MVIQLNKNSLPTVAILTTLGITMVLSLIELGSDLALHALLSLAIGALFSSYLLVSTLLLWRRNSTSFHPYGTDTLADHSAQFIWGPWRITEPFGTINNALACIYSVLLLFWSFWPQTTPTTIQTANWSVLVFASAIIFSIIWYIIRAKHFFNGPIKEV